MVTQYTYILPFALRKLDETDEGQVTVHLLPSCCISLIRYLRFEI